MRTAQRDISPILTFSADVADAASGSGLAQPGNVPFNFTRTATGQYQYQFSTQLGLLSVLATVNGANANSTSIVSLNPGTFTVVTYNNNTPANARHSWACTARDKR